MAGFAAALQDSPFGAWARESGFAYPAANLVHLLGLVMLVGGIGLLDLRIAGAFRALPLAPLSRALTPIALAGLALMAISGPIMFAADAATLFVSPVLRWKLTLIAIALLNALLFRWKGEWIVAGREPPPAARAMAVTSILLWLTVAALGRMIAYR